jgi:hypothetical protein
VTNSPRDDAVPPWDSGIGGIGSIPEIIRASGEQAEAAYRAFFGQAKLSLGTRKLYGTNARRFFEWAHRRGFTLQSISASCIDDFIAQVTTAKSQLTASIYLTPVRGIFLSLVSSGVLAENPFKSRHPNVDVPPEKVKECEARFPLLSVMAMLANMDEESLPRILNEASIANSLLEFVRWRDSVCCTHCGEQEAQMGEAQPEDAGHQCRACGREYRVTDGSPFEGSPLRLNQGLFLLFRIYLQDHPAPDIAAIAHDRGIDVESAIKLGVRFKEELDRYGLVAGGELRQVIERKNRELTQNEVARDIKEYADLEAARDTLIAVRDAGEAVTDLPPGMTLEEMLADVCARIAQHDRYVVELVDGYLTRRLAEADELNRKSCNRHDFKDDFQNPASTAGVRRHTLPT